MKISITGGSGFVGQNLIAYLKDQKEQFEIHSLDREALKTILIDTGDVFIHLAGKAHDLKKNANTNEYFEVNYELSKKMYDAFLKSGATKFIFISTVKAAADHSKEVLTENVLPNPQTDYGKSKLKAEQYIQTQPLPTGKSYYILRPCMIHGPGNKGNLNLLYKFVKKGIPYPLAGFNNKRSFLSIENLCFIIKEIITRNDIHSGIYQASDNEALSTNEVVSILSASLNVNPRLWKISPKIIRLMAKMGDGLHLPLTTERLDKLTESYEVSNGKIIKALNKQLPLTTIEGLKITASSFNKN